MNTPTTHATAQAAEPAPRPTCPCRPPKGIQGPNKAELDAAWDVLMNGGPDVRSAAIAYDIQTGVSWLTEYQMDVDAFKKHFPGFEAAIQLAADHVIDDCVVAQGCECFT
jgi:hypothetical protein